MRALVIHADPDRSGSTVALREAAVRGLQAGGHSVEVLALADEGFDWRMTTADRRAYLTDEPIVDDHVRHHAAAVRRADALVFVYPTRWFGLPAVMKGWLERVLVTGVAFELHPTTRRVRGGLGRVRRLVAVTTYPCSRFQVLRFTDGGRRSIARTVRLTCGWRCRTSWLGLYDEPRRTGDQRDAFARSVTQKMSRL